MQKEYFFIDINVGSMKVVNYGQATTATLTGKTEDPRIHRVFLTKGQFNKLEKSIKDNRKFYNHS